MTRLSAISVRNDGRLAGRVLRYHTWPHIRPQTIAEHSWQFCRILSVIWPQVPAHVLLYIIRHDCPEIKTGDAPYPVKKDNPVLAGEMDRIEQESLEELVLGGFLADSPDLTESERWVTKLAEFIEMWEWALEERLLGNQFARLVEERCLRAIWDRLDSRTLPPTSNEVNLEAIIASAKRYVRRRATEWQTN